MALDAVPPLGMIVTGGRPIRLMADGTLGLSQRDLGVVHLGRADLPAEGTVTGVAIVGSGDMAWRLPLGDLTVVASDAVAQCFAVIHAQQRDPGQGPVAGFTQFLDDISFERCGVNDVIGADQGLEERKSIMVFGSDDDILNAGVFEDLHPLFGVKLRRIEPRDDLVIFISRNLR